MSDAHWQRLKELLHEAMPLAPAERAAFLDDECAAEPDLRAELESLLDENTRMPTGFLESSSPAVAPDAQGPAGVLSPGQIFCERFRLVSKLGEGGMGQVWLAEQISPVWRRVALKLIRAGMYDESVAQRFQAERQSLAIMDHPAIAKVFDAGATPQGQPYFVMEYVPGLPITEYCDQKKLTIRQRLELFIQACEGVQHAHQKAFIHRDLSRPTFWSWKSTAARNPALSILGWRRPSRLRRSRLRPSRPWPTILCNIPDGVSFSALPAT